ncbi:uncharacterized protein [Euwallacea similis]|uniref:uncharacterized protein n=1 Tax=Euwallacea similis TaxID=1736056 RepID=UPI00344C2155
MRQSWFNFFLLLIAEVNSLNTTEDLDYLLQGIANISDIKNFVILSRSKSMDNYIKSFHRIKPTIMLNVMDNVCNSTSCTYIRTKEDWLGNYLNLFFLFLNVLEEFERVLERVILLDFWKSRFKYVVVAGFEENQVKSYSLHAFRKYWITNLVFTDYKFKELKRISGCSFNSPSDSLEFSYNFIKKLVSMRLLKMYFKVSNDPTGCPKKAGRSEVYDPFRAVLMSDTNPKIIFLNSAYNFYGHPLRILMFPNLIAVWNRTEYIGRDGYIASEIVRRLNATPKYLHTNINNYGLVLPNGTITGLLKNLYHREADAGFNTRFMFNFIPNEIDVSYPHDEDEIIILLPIEYQNRRAAFSSIIPWFQKALGGLLLLIFCIYLYFYSDLSLSDLLLISCQIVGAQNANLVAIKYYRMMLMAVVFYFFIIMAVFTSKFISMLTVPKGERQLSTIKEVSLGPFKVAAESNCKQILIAFRGKDEDDVAMDRILSKTSYYSSADFSKELAKCSTDTAFISLSKLAYYYADKVKDKDGYKNKCYYTVKQPIVPVRETFSFPSGTPILERVNHIIQTIIESGLFMHWEKIGKPIYEVKKIFPPQKINLDTLMPMLEILIVGWVVDVIVFLFELKFSRTVLPYPFSSAHVTLLTESGFFLCPFFSSPGNLQLHN